MKVSHEGPPPKEGSGWRKFGGAEGDRTLDLRIANATLSQLSYRPDMIVRTKKNQSLRNGLAS